MPLGHDRQRHDVPFPPPPRSWRALVDTVLDNVAERLRCLGVMSWEPLHLAGLDAPWVGVRSASMGEVGRPWVWDVVTPDDHERDRLLARDPLTVPIAQDVVVVDVRRDDEPGSLVRLQVPVKEVPVRLDLPAASVPPPPWRLELATGWSADAIQGAIAAWCERNVGPVIVHREGTIPMPPDPDGDDRFELDDELWVTSEAFDRLLTLDPAEAGRVTTALGAVRDALDPFT